MAELEEKLREAACFGDIDGVKELLSRGVNVNAQHDINGWTALHWAAKRNHLNIVNLLCNHGADKNIPTNKGEVAAQLTSEGVIKVLLNAMKGVGATPANKPTKVEVEQDSKLPITPNYIRNPVVGYEVDLGERKERMREAKRPVQLHKEKRMRMNNIDKYEYESQELILKIRVSGATDPDFIEIDLPRDALTLEYLIVLGCEELGLNPSNIDRVRKLPNTRLRRDREIERLEDFQEIEFVLKQTQYTQVDAAATPLPCNGVGLDNGQVDREEKHQEMSRETDSLDTIETTENGETETETEDMEHAETLLAD